MKIQDSLFFFDSEMLEPLALSLHQDYVQAQPFPHIVMDDFLPVEVAERILQEFPPHEGFQWSEYYHEHSKKLALTDEKKMGEGTRHMVSQFNGPAFLAFLEILTGIQGLIPDPHLWGGGLHQIPKGGFLNVHADFNYYKRLRLDRRLNLLLYLNTNWKEEYGGHIQLWSRDMKTCVKKVLPLFNRVVIFSTSDYSYHGLPEPLTCPDGGSRKSLALYYYTNGRPEEEKSEVHSTLYQKAPWQQDKKANLFSGAFWKKWIRKKPQ